MFNMRKQLIASLFGVWIYVFVTGHLISEALFYTYMVAVNFFIHWLLSKQKIGESNETI